MKYFANAHQRVFWLPVLLFFILLTVFGLARYYLSDYEVKKRKALANVVAMQASNSLEVFSADRKRALENLVISWPAHHPNTVDWFHTHAADIQNMLPGIYDLWWVKPDFSIHWSLLEGGKEQLKVTNISDLGLNLSNLQTSGMATTLSNYNGLMSLYALQIDPNMPSLGYVAAMFDVKTTLQLLIGELVGPQFNFSLFDQDTLLSSHGLLIDDSTLAKVKVSFAGRDWLLTLQSPAHHIPMSQLVFWLGCLMSCFVCLFFYSQLIYAVRSNKSQAHYKAASDAALDSILIYESVLNEQEQVTDFKLVDANKLALKRVQCDLKSVQNQFLSYQLGLLNVPELLADLKKVNQTGEPFEYTLRNVSYVFEGSWLKLQVVKADSGLAMTISDISVRYESQLQLKASEAKFRRLVDGLNRDFIYSLDSEGKLQFVSTSVTNILGYEVDEFIKNRDKYILSVPDDIFQIRQRQAKGLKTDSYLLTYLSLSQQVISIECNDSPVFDEHGRLMAIEGIGRDVTEDLVLKQKIYYQANHDPLTGLLNRYAFDNKLKEIISSIPSIYRSATLCYIDMDQFKVINDTCGHQAGDQLLKGIANLLQQNISENDVLARVGGDEFCLIIVEQSIESVKQSVQKLLDSVSAFRFEWQERVFHIGASIGLVQMDKANLNAVDVVKAADGACYMAKNNGRNQFVFHDNTDSGIVFRNTELQLLSQVQTALDKNSFELYFQPIKALKEDASQQQGYEILLRMFDQGGELVSPAVFIPIAERHGLMSRIDEWVFTQTLSLLERYPEHVNNLDKCAINLSGASINSPSLMKALLKALNLTSIPKHKLCFEITETSAVTNLVKASNIIHQIRQLGCQFALDDFGAGMSSFTYLKNMQVDYVKIDGSFVKNMCDDPSDLATVKAIHDIATSMGKKTIAEFVGNEKTENILKQLGVDYAQGFGIAKPTPFANYLASLPH